MNEKPADNLVLVHKILKVAMIAAVVFYPIVAVVIVQSGTATDVTPPDNPGPYLLVAAGLAVIALTLSFWLPGIIVNDARLESLIRAGDPKTPKASCRSLLFTGFVIRLALLEAIAIFGLVLSLLLMDAKYAIGFAVVSAVFMVSVRFDEERVENVYRRIEPELDG